MSLNPHSFNQWHRSTQLYPQLRRGYNFIHFAFFSSISHASVIYVSGGAHMKTGLLALMMAVSFTTASVYGQSGAAAKDNVTNEEFLALYFQMFLHGHESNALNSFNLITFYPGTDAENALLFIIQTYNDNDYSTENPQLRREIRKFGGAIVANFQARLGLPVLKKRWPLRNPKANLIIKHVRVRDLQDILAVTIDGVTSFDPADFKRGEQRFRRMVGGVWTF